MDFDVLLLIAAFGGGAFGAAIGGQPAFIFTGFMVFIGVGNGLLGGTYDFMGQVAFGPVFGPHIAFAGGAAAAAYAAKYGRLGSGRDIGTPVTGTGDPVALVIGGLFGMGGYLVQIVLAGLLATPGEVALTDSVALTVALSGLAARVFFGRTGVFGTVDPSAAERGRLRPGGAQVWVAHQQQFWQSAVLGIGGGLLAAWVVTSVHEVSPDMVPTAVNLMFGVSAVSLILLQFGLDGPVTHHMTLPAGLAAAAVVTGGGAPLLAFAAAAVVGIAGALLGELASRMFLIHGDTHIDPPAIAIFILTSGVVGLQFAFGTV